MVKSAKDVFPVDSIELKEYLSNGLVSACTNPKGTLVSIKLLIALGADLVYRNPLDVALSNGHADAVKFFLDSAVAVVGSGGLTSGTFAALAAKCASAIPGSLLELVANAAPADQIERARREWEIIDVAHKAGENGKDELLQFL